MASAPEDFPDLDFPLTFPDIVVVVGVVKGGG